MVARPPRKRESRTRPCSVRNTGGQGTRAGRRHGMLHVVAAGASDPASMLSISPCAATTMGEYFRDAGRHALCVYDDLS